MTNPIRLFALLAAGGLAACEPGGCKELSRTVVTDPHAPLHVGTLAELRATIGGVRSGPLRWLESERYVKGFPPPGETEITVAIAEPDDVWDLDFEPVNVQRNERLSCPDYAQAELEIELKTVDAVLDARIDTLATFSNTSTVSLWVDVTDEDLGNLPWDPVREDARLELVLEYGSLTGPEGSLRYSFEESDDSGNGVGFMDVLASFTLPNVHPERATSPK